MSSPSLQYKIAAARAAAPQFLQQTRLCADVVLAALEGESALQAAVDRLKQGVARKWSYTQALQFMSGRQAQLACECAAPAEHARLMRAHDLARQICEAQARKDQASPGRDAT